MSNMRYIHGVHDFYFSVFVCVCFSPIHSQASSTISCHSIQEVDNCSFEVYEDKKDAHSAPSVAHTRWIDAFNKVCAQLNKVNVLLRSFSVSLHDPV